MNDLILIIGGTNQGKSYFTKQQIMSDKIACFVYDVQNCYGAESTKQGDLVLNLPIGTKQMRCRWYGNREEFLYYAILRKNTTIVVEEATMFFEGKTSEQTRELIINKHHDRNNIIMMFHSISAVPPRIMQLSDIVVLFKTNDEEKEVSRKYAKCLPAFLKLQNMPNRSKIVINNFDPIKPKKEDENK